MGAPFEGAWETVTGAMYMGAGTSWETIWLVVSIAICVLAIWKGGKDEATSYRKAEK